MAASRSQVHRGTVLLARIAKPRISLRSEVPRALRTREIHGCDFAKWSLLRAEDVAQIAATPAPKLDEWKPFIDTWLPDDNDAPANNITLP